MCLGAFYWARLSAVYLANARAQAAAAGFDDSFIYDRVPLLPKHRQLKMIHLPHPQALTSFEEWHIIPARVSY